MGGVNLKFWAELGKRFKLSVTGTKLSPRYSKFFVFVLFLLSNLYEVDVYPVDNSAILSTHCLILHLSHCSVGIGRDIIIGRHRNTFFQILILCSNSSVFR